MPANQPRRVALVIPSLCVGGAERQVVEIARKMDASLFEVHVISLDDFMPLAEGVPEIEGRVHVLGRRKAPDLTMVWRLARLFRELEIELAHAFLFLAEVTTRLAAPLAGVEVVLGSERNSNYQLRWYRFVCLLLTSRMQKFVVANSSVGAAYNARLFHLPSARYRIVKNGVNMVRFRTRSKAECRARLGLDEDAFVVGMFASFKRQKNHPMLFRAAASIRSDIPNLRVLLVGESLYGDHDDTQDYKSEVVRLLEETVGDITTTLGNRSDVELIYPACDVVVLPSHFEGTPNVVLEAMSCGVPCIATDVSDNREIITHGSDGFIVEPDDVGGLAGLLRQFCDQAQLRREMASNAQTTARELLSSEAMCRNMAMVYSEALGVTAGAERSSLPKASTR